MIGAGGLVFYVAVSAQVMKLFFNEMSHLRVRFMAIKTHARAGSVDEIVMTFDTILIQVVGMGKLHRQHSIAGMGDHLWIVAIIAHPTANHEQQSKCRH
jgi:hypothetical protein